MSESRVCNQCKTPNLRLREKRIGTSGVKLKYECAQCQAKASHGTWANIAISLIFGLVLVPVVAFVVQGYAIDTAPKGVFGAMAVLVALGVWETVGLIRFNKAHPVAG